jgi:hypothetical protein
MVEGPNEFTAMVEQTKQSAALTSLDDFWEQFADSAVLAAAQEVVSRWLAAGYRRRLGPDHVVLSAPGPAVSRVRTVIAVYHDGRVMVPFASYEGQNSGIRIDPLTTPEFRSAADALFGFDGSERLARTIPGWLTPERVDSLLTFCFEVAKAYELALARASIAPVE